jgi:GTP cyclohydrolase I
MTVQNNITEIQELFSLMVEKKTSAPSAQQIAIWIARYGNDNTREALARTATRFNRSNGQMTPEYVINFTSAVLRRLQDEKTVTRQLATAVNNGTPFLGRETIV